MIPTLILPDAGSKSNKEGRDIGRSHTYITDPRLPIFSQKIQERKVVQLLLLQGQSEKPCHMQFAMYSTNLAIEYGSSIYVHFSDEIVDDDVFGIEDIYRNLYFQFRK